MRETPLILVVDDEPANRDILETRLTASGYAVIQAEHGLEALEKTREAKPDLILLDINMPHMDGIEVCKRLKTDDSFPYIPIIMVTALADSRDVVAGLDAGAEEYLTKPVDQSSMLARVRSMLRVKDLHDTVREQSDHLERQAGELKRWNAELEQRVTDQVAKLERLGRLKRFFSPKLAEMLLEPRGEELLQSHRREITVVFCDLRGFTAFSSQAEPEEVMQVLREYHARMGALISEFSGTLERFAGDGMMVFFNDPQPQEDHSQRAVAMAVSMRTHMETLISEWSKRGYDLGFGVGIAMGYATLGMVGFEERVDYAAIGMVTNLASRLCDKAGHGQILISQKVSADLEDKVEAEPSGSVPIKGFPEPVAIYNVVGLKWREQPSKSPSRETSG